MTDYDQLGQAIALTQKALANVADAVGRSEAHGPSPAAHAIVETYGTRAASELGKLLAALLASQRDLKGRKE